MKQNFKSSGDRAAEKFTQMIISRMESVKASDYKQDWINTQFSGMPMNLSGRCYSGANSMFLLWDATENNYKTPVYLTFLQVQELGLSVLKGEKSMPVTYWNVSYKDKDGNKITRDDYQLMTAEARKECAVHPFLRAYNVFNLDQTNMKDEQPKKYQQLLDKFKVADQLRDTDGMYKNAELDKMLTEQSWICPIQYLLPSASAYYSKTFNKIVVPKKEQFNRGGSDEDIFQDGEAFYATLIHEMTHSTGVLNNREMVGKFGSKKYAKEELVAELTAALVSYSLGFSTRIMKNHAAYLDGWIKVLKKEPTFIVSIMADVNKASKVIFEHMNKETEKIEAA